ARRFLDQLDVHRSHADLFPTRHFERAMTAQSNDVLAAWSSVPVADSTGWRPMQSTSACHHHLEDIIAIPRSEFALYLFGMCLAVRSGVEPGYEHTFVFLSAVRLRVRHQHNQAQQPSRD